jgi:hypothetical protein
MDLKGIRRSGQKLMERCVGFARRRAAKLIWERGLPTSTDPYVRLEDVGLASPGRNDYQASRWRWLRRALRGCEITRDDVLVEFGSGMGRVVYVAARRYPFGRVVGVEISQEFNDVALKNLEHERHRLRCQNVEIVTADAVEFVVPDDMTYAYLFNPFKAEIFAAVIENIVASLDRRPRRVTLCYAYPAMEEAVLATGRFTRVRSLRPRRPGLTPYHDRIDVYVSTD